MRVLVLFDPKNDHHSYRLVAGLQACGLEVVCNNQESSKYEYVFIEASLNEVPKIEATSNVFLYDVEDDPDHFAPGNAYTVFHTIALAYVKYNARKKYLNGLKIICAPLIDYMMRGYVYAQRCKDVKRQREKIDAFFVGGPSYYSLGYTPPPSANHIETFNLNTIPFNRRDPTRSTEKVYHQRLEWCAKIKANRKLNFHGGIWFEDDPNSNISLSFQKFQFGIGVENYKFHKVDQGYLINHLFYSNYGLCPSGFARSSFRLIELMALGKIILLTDDSSYRYLYNPQNFITIKDGENIDETILALNENYDSLQEQALVNHRLFLELTPQKMWGDFLNQ